MHWWKKQKEEREDYEQRMERHDRWLENYNNSVRDEHIAALEYRIAELEAPAVSTYTVELRSDLPPFLVEADSIGRTIDGFTVFRVNDTITALIPTADIKLVLVGEG